MSFLPSLESVCPVDEHGCRLEVEEFYFLSPVSPAPPFPTWRPVSSCCSLCSEHSKNSPFVAIIFCWAQLLPAFYLPDTRIRSWKIFHLRTKALSKTDDFKGPSWAESYYIGNDSRCISLPLPSLWTRGIHFCGCVGNQWRINFSKFFSLSSMQLPWLGKLFFSWLWRFFFSFSIGVCAC